MWVMSASQTWFGATAKANLGQDAETTAAIAGQLAKAVYGASAIPADWLDALAWRQRLIGVAKQPFDAGWPEAAPVEDSRSASGSRP